MLGKFCHLFELFPHLQNGTALSIPQDWWKDWKDCLNLLPYFLAERGSQIREVLGNELWEVMNQDMTEK